MKKLLQVQEALTGGHRLCAGCSESIIAKQVVMASPRPVVAILATSCLEVATTIYPYTAWMIPLLHVAFENVDAVASGVEAAYLALKKQSTLPHNEDLEILALGGDGGTYDIGLQSLSGALERKARIRRICFCNEGYMNTGIQRSSATPFGAHTTTTPRGNASFGKIEWRKDLTGIVAAHHIPYIGQAAPVTLKPHDLRIKAAKGFEADGPAFLNVLAPCSRGWGFEPKDTIAIANLAVETCYWPLFEIVEGKWNLTYEPKIKKPIRDWLAAQKRFEHLLTDEPLIEYIQKRIDEEWEALLKKCDRK
ncbi:MAG: thiamine pyrophosphate-dependent enzyme [bacterium]|nr:thiamine pyrophosphate-dependent enzyme [bacterium]